MVSILAYTTAIFLAVSQVLSDANYTDPTDVYSDENHDIYYDYYYYLSRGECPCQYYEGRHEANCVAIGVKLVPECIPDTAEVLNFLGNRLLYRPKQFERFKSVRTLILDVNRFHRLGNDLFIGLSALRELSLGSNNLDPLENNSFIGLSELRVLILDRCNITTVKNYFFNGLSNLRELYLPWNSIHEISPDSFTGLSKLEVLDLSFNKITYIDSHAFSGLIKLAVLDLSQSLVAHSVHFTSQSFEGLSALKNLTLEGIDIASTTSFPIDIFKPLLSLEELNLQKFCRSYHNDNGNCINLHEQISTIPSLERLYIDAEKMTQLGPGFSSLVNLKEIEFLTVIDIHIKSLSNDTFVNLENSPLSKVALKSDQKTHGKVMIDRVLPNTFVAFKGLHVLDYTFTSGSCSEAIRNFATGLEKTMIKNLRLSLDSSMCYRNELPDLSGTQLDILDLSHSSIQSVWDSLFGLEDREFLNKIPKSIKYLYLHHNTIEVINLTSLHTFEQLLVLDMSYQMLKSMRVKRRALVSNETRSTTEKYQMEKLLEKGDESVDEEELRWSQEECFPLPYNLQFIDISYSRLLSQLSRTFCNTNNSLKALNLSNPQFKQPMGLWKPLKALLKLEDLNLNGNGINFIPSNAFSGLTRMKSLSLVDNKLTSISFEVTSLVNLEILDLSDNSIQYATDQFSSQIDRIAENQPNLVVLLHDNLLVCDCERITFLKWLLDTMARQYQDLSCTYENGSLIFLEDITETIYVQLQRDCVSNQQSQGASAAAWSTTSLIVCLVLGLIILALLIIILALIWRKRQKTTRNTEDDIVLT